MSGFLERLAGRRCVLLDDGLGSMLISRGLQPGSPPESWNLARPDDVTAVHVAYVRAGSDAVHANTFGANPVRLARFGLEDRLEEINVEGVRLARASGAAFVIGDVGPTGEHLPPVGHGSIEAWRSAYERQGRVLALAGVDAIHVETMSDRREAMVALEALLEVAPGVPVMVSLTFEKKPRGFFTMFGDRPIEALTALATAGAGAVGANCSIPSPMMRELGSDLLRTCTFPLVLQPNAGRPEQGADGVRYLQDPLEFAADMSALVEAGACAVGGCCGTDPRFIHELRRRLEARGS
jgi:5-methyltetrahydrofolate--homocysteine methyltransferase